MRDYGLMKKLLYMASKNDAPFGVSAVLSGGLGQAAVVELKRLQDDGLLNGNIELDDADEYQRGDATGLTKEGREFYRLIERGDAWAIMLETLDKAGIDVSYPLLKEVCEEVVKRYVVSFIPEIGPRVWAGGA